MMEERIALVTRANQGIGLQIAKDLATGLNGFNGTRSVEQGAREPIRLALIGEDGPTGTFSDEDGGVPW